VIDVKSLTANQMDDEIRELAKLEKAGDLTVDGSFRLRELRYHRKLIGRMARQRWL